MSVIFLPNQHPGDNRLAELIKDTRDASLLLDRMTVSLRDVNAKAPNLWRLMMRINRNIALLARQPNAEV